MQVQHLGFFDGSDGKESACSAGDLGWYLGQEDPLEKGMATHWSIFAGEFQGQEEPGRLQFVVLQTVRHAWVTNTFTLFFQSILHMATRASS